MLRTNAHQLVTIAVEGKVAPALVWPNEVGCDGVARNVPGVGGITYNVLVGDSAYGWAGDHIEPAVSSTQNPEKRSDKPNVAYNFLACVGNEAIVLSGEAKGARGRVTGTHGGVEHVMLDFAPDVLDKLSVDDRFQIRAVGQGLQLLEYPQVRVTSLDPELLQRMGCTPQGGQLQVPVTAVIPGKLMGSGLGSLNVCTGDFDIMTADRAQLAQHKLDQIKLGDVVAVADIDASHGWCYREGAMMIGVVVHSDSFASGHGPGVAAIMTAAGDALSPVLDTHANIGKYLKIGRYR